MLIAKYLNFNPYVDDAIPVQSNIENYSQSQNQEFLKGMWVPYMALDVSESQDTEQAFKNNFQNIIDTALEHNINTLVVHVRSHSDALYSSKIFPTSHILTGKQGENVNFDPLDYMVKTAHANNLKFHAWINPLRVTTLSVPTKICDSNPCKNDLFADKLIHHKDGIIYNPGYPEVRNLVADGVAEIVRNYDVDAIHFDDYFYPEIHNMTSPDTPYEKYLEITTNNPQAQDIQRIQNINLLIQQVHETIQNIKPSVEFGISPPGNINKCSCVGIDVKTWLSNNYVEYICPQIYWSLECPECPFEKALNNWKKMVSESNTNARFYVGLALYKIGTDADNDTWNNDKKIIAKEMELSHTNNSKGVILYSSNQLQALKNSEELRYLDDVLKNQ